MLQILEMHIILIADEDAYQEFKLSIPETINLSRISADEFNSTLIADACFVLNDDADFTTLDANPALQLFLIQ